MKPRNIFADLPQSGLAGELVEELLAAPGWRLERIVSTGQADGPWLDQERPEWVVLLKGAARLEFEDGGVTALSPGDWLVIAAHRKHRVLWTDPAQPTVWLALHYDG